MPLRDLLRGDVQKKLRGNLLRARGNRGDAVRKAGRAVAEKKVRADQFACFPA